MATLQSIFSDYIEIYVSIHATLAGGDHLELQSSAQLEPFLSTPPSRVATLTASTLRSPNNVSIHATLAGGDRKMLKAMGIEEGFYPRHPRGWRRSNGSLWALRSIVSIHATLAGGDNFTPIFQEFSAMFLSTPPSRVATHRVAAHNV